MHYGPCGYRCLAAAAFALTNMTRPNRIKFSASVFRADKSLRKTFSVQITPASILCCEPFPKLAPEADFMVSIPYLIRFFYCFFSFCWSYLHLLFHSTLCWLKPIRIFCFRGATFVVFVSVIMKGGLKMTEYQKKQIDACRENGLTISATAAKTGLPLGTVKTRI